MNFLRRFSRVHPVEWGIYFILAMILLSVIAMGVLQIYSVIYTRKKDRYKKGLKELFLKTINDNVILPKEMFVPYLRDLAVIVSMIREFNNKISGEIWEATKKMLIHEVLQRPLLKAVRSHDWKRKCWALQAWILCPSMDYLACILPLLKHKVPAVRYSAASCAIQLDSQEAINAILEVMSQEESYARYPFRDLFLNTGAMVFNYVRNRLGELEDPLQRICALEILSQRAGYIDLNLIRSDLESENPELQWWAVRALENCASQEKGDLLIHFSKKGDPRTRAVAIRCLGNVVEKKALPLLEQFLKDEYYFLRIEAGLAIRKMGQDGLLTLKNQRREVSLEAYDAAQYALSLPEFSVNIEPIQWYRYY